METNSQVSIKQQKSLVGIVECIREFKLPQTYPSMAKYAKGDSNVPAQSSVQLLSKSSNIIEANIPFKDGQIAPKLQKLKLKSSDGRDLGEFDVQIVNQNRNLSINTLNVQSKTNNLSGSEYKDNNIRKYVQCTAGKNAISSQSAAVKYLTKPIQLEVPETSQGVLIPISSNVTTNDSNENSQSSIPVDSHKKKQFFIVQPTKNNWQALKNGQTTNLSSIILKPQANEDQMELKNIKQVKTVPQRVQLTHKPPVVTYKNNNGVIKTGVKRKLDESVFKPTGIKDKKFVNIGNSNIVMKLEGIEESNSTDNVIYVVPSNNNLTENESIEVVENKSKFLRNSQGRVNLIRRGRKNPLINRSLFNEDNETLLDHSSFQYNDSSPNNDLSSDNPVDNISSKLSIVGHALSTIGDEELKAKALKALADCGIGMERLIPAKPPPNWKSIKESHCQTNVFGLLDKKNFIKVDGDSDRLERVQEIETKINDSTEVSKESSSNNTSEFSENLNKMLDTFCINKNNVEQMREIFKVHPLVEKAHQLLEKDFKNCKKYDKNGMLNIHKAVLNNQQKTVNRQIMVLKNSKCSIDLPTTDGQTSLELAVRHGISREIIQMLLKAGARPTASESHDSALALASKQSSPCLLTLIPYLSTTDPAINNFDSEGFTALHYCAINGYEEGVNELIRIQVDLNARDCKSGRTALFHALENEHLPICKKLLAHGAKGNIPNFAGQTVFALFDDDKHFTLKDSLQRSIK